METIPDSLLPAVEELIRTASLKAHTLFAGRELTRDERKGMFVTTLRSNIYDSKLGLYKGRRHYWNGHWGNVKSQEIMEPTQAGSERLCSDLLRPETWFDAGVLAENFNHVSSNPKVRFIVEKVKDEIDSSEKAQLARLNGLLANADIAIVAAAQVNEDLTKMATVAQGRVRALNLEQRS